MSSNTSTADLAHYAEATAQQLPGTWHGTAKSAFVGAIERLDGARLEIFRTGTRVNITPAYPDGRTAQHAGMDYNRGPDHAAQQIIRRLLPTLEHTYPEAVMTARAHRDAQTARRHELADWLTKAQAIAPRTTIYTSGPDGHQHITVYFGDSQRITADLEDGLPAYNLRMLGSISGPALLEILKVLARESNHAPAYAAA